MKDFFELIKNPTDLIQYSLNNILTKIIQLFEQLGFNMIKGIYNLILNIFSIVPNTPIINPIINHKLNKEHFKDYSNKPSSLKPTSHYLHQKKQLLSHNENDYNNYLLNSDIFLKDTIYPINYHFINKSSDIPLKPYKKNTPPQCEKEAMQQWKNTPYINRPWFEECHRGYCKNYENYEIDDLNNVEASEDSTFQSTI